MLDSLRMKGTARIASWVFPAAIAFAPLPSLAAFPLMKRASRILLWATLAALTIALAPLPAMAAWGPHGMRLSTSGATQDLPITVSDGAGGAIVIWRDSRGADRDVYAQRVLADGTIAWAPEGVLVATGPGDPLRLHATPDGTGGAVAAWTLANGNVRSQRIAADGSVAAGWPADGVLIGTNWDDKFDGKDPRCVTDGAGGAWILWHSEWNYEIARVVGTGQVEAPQRVGAEHGAAGLEPWEAALTATGTGHIILGYLKFLYPTVYAAKSGPSGPNWTTTIASDGSLGMTEVDAAADMSGGGYIAWLGGSTLAVVRVHADGSFPAGWPTNGVTIGTGYGSGQPRGMVSDGLGGALLAWNNFIPQFVLQRITPSGEFPPGWPSGGLVLTSRNVPAYGIAKDGSGGTFATWIDGGTLYAQHVLQDASIDPYWPAAGHVICEAGGQQQPSMASTEAGGAIVGWSDLRGTNPWIFAHWLNSGELLGVGPRGTEALALAIVGSNPVRDAVDLGFTLSRGSRVRIDLIDVSGRVVERIDLGDLPAGPHRQRIAMPSASTSAVYFLRLTDGVSSHAVRFARLR